MLLNQFGGCGAFFRSQPARERETVKQQDLLVTIFAGDVFNSFGKARRLALDEHVIHERQRLERRRRVRPARQGDRRGGTVERFQHRVARCVDGNPVDTPAIELG